LSMWIRTEQRCERREEEGCCCRRCHRGTSRAAPPGGIRTPHPPEEEENRVRWRRWLLLRRRRREGRGVAGCRAGAAGAAVASSCCAPFTGRADPTRNRKDQDPDHPEQDRRTHNECPIDGAPPLPARPSTGNNVGDVNQTAPPPLEEGDASSNQWLELASSTTASTPCKNTRHVDVIADVFNLLQIINVMSTSFLLKDNFIMRHNVRPHGRPTQQSSCWQPAG
jgi:hypothetical protein